MTPNTFPKLKGTIFIVTYGRSGSTLLQSLLQSIPGSHIVGENYSIMESLFQAGRRATKTRRKWGRKDQPKDHPWHNADKARPIRFEQELVNVFVRNVLAPPKDVRWFGFKEIRFAAVGEGFEAFLQFYQANFHNAFFVFNSRSGEDVANSAWWKNKPRDEVLAMVQMMDARFAQFAASNPDCSQHVFYENTLKDPSSLQPLFDKLGEPLDLATVQDILERRLNH